MASLTAASKAIERRNRWKWILAIGALLLVLDMFGIRVVTLLEVAFPLMFVPVLLVDSRAQLLIASLEEKTLGKKIVLQCADYLELTRPRIAVLILFTVAAGFGLASTGAPDLARLLHTVFGTALVVAGASALNQVFERHSDARMERTRNRPVPSGRLKPRAVLLFGVGLALAGIVYVAVTVRQPLAVAAAAFAFTSYTFLYTPLKRITTVNTLVGAVPGAISPVIGWTAVTNSFDPAAGVLFAILFLWQVPHSLAIAWIYRHDYARAGLRMLPVVDANGDRTARYMVGYSLALLAVGLVPAALGLAGGFYFISAAFLGVGFVTCALGFLHTRSEVQARRVLRASLVYLPALLTVLLVEGAIQSWAGTR